MTLKRGALIVVEGVDRTGKTTQCKALVENLRKQLIPAQYTNFPNRETEIGKMINNYLTSKSDLSDEAVHLLFSANRWEKASSIKKILESGVSVVVDRYCYSGVAFSAAKGLDINWCKAADVGLPQPDKVFFLTMPLDTVQQRHGYGNERYEVLDFQNKVSKIYEKLKDNYWEVLDANRSIEDVQCELLQKSMKIVKDVQHTTIERVWMT